MRTFLLTLALVALAFPTSAETCYPSTKEPETTLDTPDGRTYYVDSDPGCQPDCEPSWPSVWIYEESNGMAGLQRQDENEDDTCGGQIPSDTLVF